MSATNLRAVSQEMLPKRGHTGAEFILDLFNEDDYALWGVDGSPLWASGEGLVIAGDQGVGKSTIAQQVVLALIGIRPPNFLGLPVVPLDKGQQVLYLAMDRPRQVSRSFRRMVTEDDREYLDERLRVHKGPLPADEVDVVRKPPSFADWIEASYPDTCVVVIDSLKDLAVGLSQDDVGAAVNSALQEVIARGIEVLVLHHVRKANSDNKSPNTLADVYGSGWITAGQGSVVFLDAKPGSRIVELSHLKQPSEPVGPLHITHDHATGTSTVSNAVNDVLAMLSAAGKAGVTHLEVAREIVGSTDRAGQQKARRRLNKLVEEGCARYVEGKSGGSKNAVRPGRWYLKVNGR